MQGVSTVCYIEADVLPSRKSDQGHLAGSSSDIAAYSYRFHRGRADPGIRYETCHEKCGAARLGVAQLQTRLYPKPRRQPVVA